MGLRRFKKRKWKMETCSTYATCSSSVAKAEIPSKSDIEFPNSIDEERLKRILISRKIIELSDTRKKEELVGLFKSHVIPKPCRRRLRTSSDIEKTDISTLKRKIESISVSENGLPSADLIETDTDVPMSSSVDKKVDIKTGTVVKIPKVESSSRPIKLKRKSFEKIATLSKTAKQ